MMRVLYHRWFYGFLAAASLGPAVLNLARLCCDWIRPQWVIVVLVIVQTVAGSMALWLCWNLSSRKWRRPSGDSSDR